MKVEIKEPVDKRTEMKNIRGQKIIIIKENDKKVS